MTGLDLYDRYKTQDAVIGLAWVSGMCHRDYSCTINEGNNYESVFVIAHEMGHKWAYIFFRTYIFMIDTFLQSGNESRRRDERGE